MKKTFVEMKGKIYQNGLKSAMLYGSESWFLRENGKAILKTEKAIKEIREVKLIEKMSSQEFMDLLGLEGALAGASVLRWYGHVFRRDGDDGLRGALDFEVVGRRGHGRPTMMWRRKVEENIKQIGPKKEDATDRTKWCNGVYALSRSIK